MNQNQNFYKGSQRAFVFVSFLSGILFALGLAISGMNNPKNVIGYLDFFGQWKPGLAWVMGGAISIYMVFHAIWKKKPKPIIAPDWSHMPQPGPHLPRLAQLGNILFGVGWGLSGYCPGPALASLPSLLNSPWVFTGAMVLGFLIWDLVLAQRSL